MDATALYAEIDRQMHEVLPPLFRAEEYPAQDLSWEFDAERLEAAPRVTDQSSANRAAILLSAIERNCEYSESQYQNPRNPPVAGLQSRMQALRQRVRNLGTACGFVTTAPEQAARLVAE